MSSDDEKLDLQAKTNFLKEELRKLIKVKFPLSNAKIK